VGYRCILGPLLWRKRRRGLGRRPLLSFEGRVRLLPLAGPKIDTITNMLGGVSMRSFVKIDLSIWLHQICLDGCSSISLSTYVVVPRHELVLLTALHL